MNYYGGIDLHSDNSVIVIIDEHDKILYEKRLANDLQLILDALTPYKQQLSGLVLVASQTRN